MSKTRPAGSTGSDGDELRARLRALPSVEELRRAMTADAIGERTETTAAMPASAGMMRQVIQAARDTLTRARASIRAGGATPTLATLRDEARRALAQSTRSALRPVINATGVIVNTNLGRAPLSTDALESIVAVAGGYSNLEFDLIAGERGSRQTTVRTLLRELTGAEDALVVNNNAAAVLLALAALAHTREVVISRGELVEIGGGFRIPDVLRTSGARLVEVGTTNRTRLADFAAAITPETAALLAVHPSNFRIIGFTESPALHDLAALAHARALPLIHDLGSGALEPTERYGLAHEPMPRESIAAGADLVCFSADKLLGGPQAGILAGRAVLISELASHPLARALRIDKLSLAALEATLRQHQSGGVAAIPVWHMIAIPAERLRERAERWAQQLCAAGVMAQAIAGESTIGGGSLPGETLPTTLCSIVQADEPVDGGSRRASGSGPIVPGATMPGAMIPVADVGALAARLRLGDPPVVARVLRKRLLLDPRTVAPAMDDALIAAILAVVRDMAA